MSTGTCNLFLIGLTIVYTYLSWYHDGTIPIVVKILSRVDTFINIEIISICDWWQNLIAIKFSYQSLVLPFDGYLL